jgi:glycosyltransferase involved in cell wall biosynthesis
MMRTWSNRLVAFDAQIQSSVSISGVETHLMALVQALGRLEGPEQYLVVCSPEHPDWLREYIGPNQSIVLGPERPLAVRLIKLASGKLWPRLWSISQRAWLHYAGQSEGERKPPGWIRDSNGFFEDLGAAVLHIFYQVYVRAQIPVVFNPHDLQHEHYPQFFDPDDLARRKFVYLRACRTASAVVAASRYTRDDVINHYHIPPEKVWVIPFGPATAAYKPATNEHVHETARKYGLVQPFMLYPAMTWEHKNHIRLLKALVRLRNQGIDLNLVCTGSRSEPTWSKIRRFISESGLSDQVRFLGFVPNRDLRALYRLCQFVIVPSLFEQASGPMFEAWQESAPVAASNVTSLPEQAGDAALLFDPFSVEAIMEAIRRMSTDMALREVLIKRGSRRLQDFSWERTAKAYRALYRRMAGWPMSEEDHYLLGWDWMSDPRREIQEKEHSVNHRSPAR